MLIERSTDTRKGSGYSPAPLSMPSTPLDALETNRPSFESPGPDSPALQAHQSCSRGHRLLGYRSYQVCDVVREILDSEPPHQPAEAVRKEVEPGDCSTRAASEGSPNQYTRNTRKGQLPAPLKIQLEREITTSRANPDPIRLDFDPAARRP